MEDPNVQRPSDRLEGGSSLSRRKFLSRTTAAGAAFTAGAALSAPAVLARSAARDFKVGVIGCGGRGSGAAGNAVEAAKMTGDNLTIHAIADLFPDKAARPARQFGVPKERVFTGFDGFRKLLETEVDYVILATPPHFRPEQFEAAIQAGKHVFTEKPVAVDPPGIRRFLAAGKMAKEKGLSVAAGTQRRHQKQYVEAAKRVQDGAIGDIVSGRCYWNQGGLWSVEPQEGWSEMEWQVRDWLYFTWLSGDHIVEQHVHNLDVCNWFIGTHPVRARGMGGREVRKDHVKYGNIFDHFATELIYPNPNPGNGQPDVRVISMCRQIAGCWNDVSEFLVGSKGSTNCSSKIWGAGEWNWSGEQVNPYVQEHVALIESIKGGAGALNETENVAHSTMTAILARTSCYTGGEVSWEELMKSEERLGPEKYEFGPAPKIVVARPGQPM
jgi:predicted dehydrogenase